MNLNLGILAKGLEAYDPVIPVCGPMKLDLKAVRIFPDQPEQLCEEYVYLVVPDRLRSGCVSPSVQLICVGYDQEMAELCRAGNILFLKKSAELLTIFHEVSRIFEQFEDAFQELLTAIVYEKTIDDMLRPLSVMFQNPIILLDSSYVVLGIAKRVNERTIDTQKWWSILERGHASPCTIQRIAQRRSKGQSIGSRANFTSANPEIYSAVTLKLSDDTGTQLAMLTIPEDFTTLNPGFLPLADYLGDYIRHELLRRANASQKRISSLERFFGRLLDGEFVSTEFAKSHLDSLNWKPDDRYQCCVIELTQSECDAGSVHFEAAQIKQILGECFYLFQKNYQVFICNLRYQPITKETVDTLCALLEERGSYAGFSSEMQGLEDLDSYFTLAAEAIRLGKRFRKRVTFYSDCVLEHLVDLEHKPKNMLSMCHRDVVELYELDCAGGTEYIDTLYAYLSNERSLIKAAAELFIHRSTIVYRLDKINDIVDADYDDKRTRAYLLASCRIVRYYKKGLLLY